MSTLRETFSEDQIEHMQTSMKFAEAITPKRAAEIDEMFAEDLNTQEATELGRTLTAAVDAANESRGELVSPFYLKADVPRRGRI